MKPKMPRYPEASDALPIKERKQGETETKERTQQMQKGLTSFTSVIDRLQDLSSPSDSFGVRDDIADDYSTNITDGIDRRLRCEMTCQRVESDLGDLVLLLALATYGMVNSIES